jgi:hypothetical protein
VDREARRSECTEVEVQEETSAELVLALAKLLLCGLPLLNKPRLQSEGFKSAQCLRRYLGFYPLVTYHVALRTQHRCEDLGRLP